MTTTHPGHVIVQGGTCAGDAVHTTQVHHRHFPEVWAECASPADGAAHLLDLLRRFREGACSHYRRDAIEEAIADVEAYLAALAERESAPERHAVGDERDVVSARCSANGPQGLADE